MSKLGGLLCLSLLSLGLALPKPGSEEDVQAFREFIEKAKYDDGYTLDDRMQVNPEASPWENSGKFEGDMIFTDDQTTEFVNDYAGTRMAYTRPNTRWPRNVVVYEFGANEFNAQQRQAILNAIRDIERNTCIRFRVRNASDRNFVRLTGRPTGCYAHVGFHSHLGVHTLNLARDTPGRGCLMHTVIVHEWFHILGFFHMHSTYNRYNYVRIHWENIVNGFAFAFYRYPNTRVSNLGLPYEYISIMHYGTHAFSSNRRPTISATRSFQGVMGQQRAVTRLDWLRARRHYNCPGAWSEDVEDMHEEANHKTMKAQAELDQNQMEYQPEERDQKEFELEKDILYGKANYEPLQTQEEFNYNQLENQPEEANQQEFEPDQDILRDDANNDAVHEERQPEEPYQQE